MYSFHFKALFDGTKRLTCDFILNVLQSQFLHINESTKDCIQFFKNENIYIQQYFLLIFSIHTL